MHPSYGIEPSSKGETRIPTVRMWSDDVVWYRTLFDVQNYFDTIGIELMRALGMDKLAIEASPPKIRYLYLLVQFNKYLEAK